MLSDRKLVALIVARSNMDAVRAREALTILRGEVEPKTTI